MRKNFFALRARGQYLLLFCKFWENSCINFKFLDAFWTILAIEAQRSMEVFLGPKRKNFFTFFEPP
jgi:hypothetical protein